MAGYAADLQLTSVDDALLGSLDVIRSVQMREWNIFILSSLCFALGSIPRCSKDVRAFCPFVVSFGVPFLEGRVLFLAGMLIIGERQDT